MRRDLKSKPGGGGGGGIGGAPPGAGGGAPPGAGGGAGIAEPPPIGGIALGTAGIADLDDFGIAGIAPRDLLFRKRYNYMLTCHVL